MNKKRKRRSYKFTEKKQSKLAVGAIVTALFSGIVLALFLFEAFQTEGNASVYFGSMGILAMLGTIASLIVSLLSLREEKVFKAIPITAVVLNGLFFMAWAIVYLIGFKIIR